MSRPIALAVDGSALARAGSAVRNVVVAVWVGLVVALLRHREVISSDTLSNYIHVWYIADRLWDGHGIPFHMPVLASGDALAFPYAFAPWMVAALTWPLVGEWSVTISLGVGFVGLVAATFWAFPELRTGWWAVAVLVNPALVEGLLLGQLPFLWAAAMFIGAVGCWRRERYGWAIVLAALAQATHVAILGPLVALVVVGRLPFERDRRRLIQSWLVSVVPALPAVGMVLASPFAEDQSLLLTLWIEVETLALRALILVVPVVLFALQRRGAHLRAAVGIVALLVVGQIVTLPVSGMDVGWGALTRDPEPAVADFARSPQFVPGATYRVLTEGDGKYAHYAIVRAGGILDSEFFPESMHRRGFRDADSYARFLLDRDVDFVVVQERYRKFRSNEPDLLLDLSASGVGCSAGVEITKAADRPYDVTVYSVRRGCRR